jgi:hypothetical protein
MNEKVSYITLSNHPFVVCFAPHLGEEGKSGIS